jgi:hypothetical protein
MPLPLPLAAFLAAPLAAASTVDSTTWAALALVLTLLGAAWTWVSWRRRGVAAGLRALAWTLIPVAAWLTGTLRLIGGIVEDVVDWAARLVFSPSVWLGVIVAAVAVGLWVLSGLMRARGIGARGEGQQDRPVGSGRGTPEVGAGKAGRSGKAGRTRAASKPAPASDDDDDMADIEAILKRHGI